MNNNTWKITKKYILIPKFNTEFVFTILDVIHTVGPKGEKPDLLQKAYESCLDLAVEKKLRTIVSN